MRRRTWLTHWAWATLWVLTCAWFVTVWASDVNEVREELGGTPQWGWSPLELVLWGLGAAMLVTLAVGALRRARPGFDAGAARS